MPFEQITTTKEKSKDEKAEWGQDAEKEIYIPFFTETMGDIFDLAIKTSREVDEGPPKIDIIVRFKKDGSHLAVQAASLELNKRGREKLEEKKECRRFNPFWKMERISKDCQYYPQNPEEYAPKVVLNFDHNVICDAQFDWTGDGRKRRWFDYFKEREQKENNKYRDDILKQIIEELEDIIEEDEFRKKVSQNHKPKYDCKSLIQPKLVILKKALAESSN